MVFDAEVFGANLRKYREKKNISVKQISEMLYVSTQIVYEWENANKLPQADKLLLIMVEYDLTAKQLLEKNA